MRNKLIIAGLLAAVAAAPSLALAQPGCVRSNQQTTGTGAVLGAIGGALIGNALGGRHSRGIDTAAGAVAGGVAGGALANGYNDPCAQGYYRPGPPPPAYGPGPGGFWAGAPQGIHQRIDFIQSRINRASADGRIPPHQTRMANRDLNDIRRQDQNLRDRDGGHLNPPDREYLQGRLDTLSQRLHWDARWGY
jgi:uncharacterized membrane protein YebE (DUF533 family)